MKESIDKLVTLFVETFSDCERFANLARAKEFQIESCKKLQILQEKILEIKKIAIECKNENIANRLLYYQFVTQALLYELKMWIAFKENNPEKAWDFLISSQSYLSGAVRAYEVGDLLDPYIEKLHLLEEFLFPNMMFSSVGIEAQKRVCSICKREYETCSHIKGKPYMGELCHIIIEKCKLEEISIVENPANKHCRMTSIKENGVTRNLMTWEVINENSCLHS